MTESLSLSDFSSLTFPEAMSFRQMNGYIQGLSTGQYGAESLGDVLRRIMLPTLDSLLEAAPFSRTAFTRLHETVRSTQRFFALSRYFQKETDRFMNSPENLCLQKRIRFSLSSAAGLIEKQAGNTFRELFTRLEKPSAIISTLRNLTSPNTFFHDPILQFERIPQVFAEIKHANINESSHVAVIGCGATALSGLGYALAGARVSLIDRDPEALASLQQLLVSVPSLLRSRLELVLVDGREMRYPSKDFTHVLVAGLIDGKEEILTSLLEAEQEASPLILLRAPQSNLLKLFYFPVEESILARFTPLGRVDIGLEGFNVTHLLTRSSLAVQ